jgi:hypothetical protein
MSNNPVIDGMIPHRDELSKGVIFAQSFVNTQEVAFTLSATKTPCSYVQHTTHPSIAHHRSLDALQKCPAAFLFVAIMPSLEELQAVVGH